MRFYLALGFGCLTAVACGFLPLIAYAEDDIHAPLEAAADISGIPIGTWRVGSPIRLAGQRRSYYAAAESEPYTKTSSSFFVTCSGGRYALSIFAARPSVPWRGQMFVQTDAGDAFVTEAVAPRPFDGEFEIDSAAMTADALDVLAHAKRRIVVTFDGRLVAQIFPAQKTAEALSALASACSTADQRQ